MSSIGGSSFVRHGDAYGTLPVSENPVVSPAMSVYRRERDAFCRKMCTITIWLGNSIYFHPEVVELSERSWSADLRGNGPTGGIQKAYFHGAHARWSGGDQQLQVKSLVGETRRALASAFPQDDSCSKLSGRKGEDEDSADKRLYEREGWASLPLTQSCWERSLEASLEQLGEPATLCGLVIPNLCSRDALSLVRSVTMIAVIELSGFAFVPSELQPLRTWVAGEYVRLTQKALRLHGSAPDCSSDLKLIRKLQKFVEKLSERPPEEFLSPSKGYVKIMTRQAKLAYVSSYNVRNVLKDFPSTVAPEVCTVSDHRLSVSFEVLTKVFKERRRQSLRSFFTRHWLQCCQEQLQTPLFYTDQNFKWASKWPLGTTAKEVGRILKAIKSAGGVPVKPLLSGEKLDVPLAKTDTSSAEQRAQQSPPSSQDPSRVPGYHAPAASSGNSHFADLEPKLFIGGESQVALPNMQQHLSSTTQSSSERTLFASSVGPGSDGELAKERHRLQHAGATHADVEVAAAQASDDPLLLIWNKAALPGGNRDAAGRHSSSSTNELDEFDELSKLITAAVDWNLSTAEEEVQ
ncbi:hypothetical protein Efla_006525 [Eimeria flavescens]